MARTSPSSRLGSTFLIALPVVVGLAWGGAWWGPFSGNADPAVEAAPEVASAATASEGIAGPRSTPVAGPAVPVATTATPPVVEAGPAVNEPGVDDVRAPTPAELAAVRELRGTLRSLLPVDRWRSSRWSVLVTSLDRGDTLFARNAHETLAPASNVKLLTTAAALHHLGEGFRFQTFLLSDGTVADGRLDGDLVLFGTGDPTLGDDPRHPDQEPLRIMARQLRERGVRVVDGDLVGDGSYFGDEVRPASWGSRSLNEWFAAPVASLQYNENVATLRIRAGARTGGPVDVEIVPDGAPVPLDVQAETVTRRTRHPVWAVRETLDEPVVLIGQQELDDREIWRRMPVPDPALYAAIRLRTILEEEGIEVRGEVRSDPGGSRSRVTGNDLWAPGMEGSPAPVVLAEHRSPPLLQLLRVVNRESHNLYAESIARTLGRVVAGDASFEAGARVIRTFLVDEIGVPAEEVRPLDGSGLSPGSRVSPYALVTLLDHVYQGPHWDSFWSTLPEAGNWRQLRRMYRSPAAGNLRAKTGTLRSVSALTGVVEARNGERLAFSILANDVPSTSMAKAVEDRIGIQLASFSRPGTVPPLAGPDPTVRLEE
ncbi:MAG: D-alanyl-D-alanine carboxypeptidase/D-alanyl-D-alanine-endopeptidase [Longimicrobiales bacterium]|nr:D-alanyl-D-alanine carboxypeptidase/D-alanyl-D-alanine-endopeptidase [Longimicrobiales bacterium]